MTDHRDVTCRATRRPALWALIGLVATVAGLAVLGMVVRVSGQGHDALGDRASAAWLAAGASLVLTGLGALYASSARVNAGADGLHSRTILRRRSVGWHAVADVRIQRQRGQGRDIRRVSLLLRNGRSWRLPLPYAGLSHDPDFDATLDALRTLHRRHGAPESTHLPVISRRTAGRTWAGSLAMCVVLLASGAVAAWLVPATAAQAEAWRSAVPCTAETPAPERRACLTTLPAVVARTHARDGFSRSDRSRLYFADGRPLTRLTVSDEAADRFQPGDRVELTVWRGEVRVVRGERYVWRAHAPAAGELAAFAAACALAAGYPGSRVLLRWRGRRLPVDEVLPSALPFVGVLVGTAAWLLPLCYLHPTTLLTSPVTITWALAGSLVTLGLAGWAWRATRVRTPGEGGVGEGSGGQGSEHLLSGSGAGGVTGGSAR